MSWWVARLNNVKLHVPKFSLVEITGRRERWLDIDLAVLRSLATAPIAILMGQSAQERVQGLLSHSLRLVSKSRACGSRPSLSSPSSDLMGVALCSRTPFLVHRPNGVAWCQACGVTWASLRARYWRMIAWCRATRGRCLGQLDCPKERRFSKIRQTRRENDSFVYGATHSHGGLLAVPSFARMWQRTSEVAPVRTPRPGFFGPA